MVPRTKLKGGHAASLQPMFLGSWRIKLFHLRGEDRGEVIGADEELTRIFSHLWAGSYSKQHIWRAEGSPVGYSRGEKSKREKVLFPDLLANSMRMKGGHSRRVDIA